MKQEIWSIHTSLREGESQRRYAEKQVLCVTLKKGLEALVGAGHHIDHVVLSAGDNVFLAIVTPS